MLAGRRIPAFAHSALSCLAVPRTSLTTSLASRRSATARRFTLLPHPAHSPYCFVGIAPHHASTTGASAERYTRLGGVDRRVDPSGKIGDVLIPGEHVPARQQGNWIHDRGVRQRLHGGARVHGLRVVETQTQNVADSNPVSPTKTVGNKGVSNGSTNLLIDSVHK